MRKAFSELMQRSDLVTLAAGLTMALATFYLVEAVVSDLIAPLISIFVGDPLFESNTFTIQGTEFRYGAFIETAITFALVAALVYFLVVVRQRDTPGKGAGGKTRECPECTSSIPVAARRCPHCTAAVRPSSA